MFTLYNYRRNGEEWWIPWEPGGVAVVTAHDQEVERIAAELAEIARSGKVLAGTIRERRTRCGRANCACHGDPPRLHGPYFQWTRKIANKTVGRWLSRELRDEYTTWVENDRRIHALVARLEALGAANLDGEIEASR